MKKDVLYISTNFPGRARFKFKTKPHKLPNIDGLLKIQGVEELTYNSVTFSILIIYNTKEISFSDLLNNLRKKMTDVNLLEDSKDADVENSEDLLSQLIYGTTSKANRKVKQKTKGYADLSSIIPSALILGGIGSLAARPILPKWYDFIWWGYNIFLHHSKDYRAK